MKYVEIIADTGHVDTVTAIAEQLELSDIRVGALNEDGTQQIRLLVQNNKIQKTLDKLQKALSTQPNEKIVVLPIEVSLPKLSDQERRDENLATTSRETLYSDIEKNSHLDFIASTTASRNLNVSILRAKRRPLLLAVHLTFP